MINYIRRSAATDALLEETSLEGYDLEEAVNAIRSIPAADVRPVIFCKDCVHRPIMTKEGQDYGMSVEAVDDWCPYTCADQCYNEYPHDDWFCNRGERKQEVAAGE